MRNLYELISYEHVNFYTTLQNLNKYKSMYFNWFVILRVENS